MTENNSSRAINPMKIFASLFFIPLTIPIFLLFLLIANPSNMDSLNLSDIFTVLILSFTYGAVIWIPSVLFCLMAEALTIQSTSRTNSVIGVLIAEVCIVFIVIAKLTGDITEQAMIILFLAMTTTQALRWWYLIYNSRMYTDPVQKGKKSVVPDDQEPKK